MRLLAMFAVVLVSFIALAALSAAAPEGAPADVEMRPVVEKAVQFLRTHQESDGSFNKKLGGPGISALVVAALIRHGYADDPVVAKGLKFLESSVQQDGGIYEKSLANYTTSVALIAFKEANQAGKYDTVVKNAGAFLKTLQHSDDPTKPEFGGVGYDAKSRPDMSNVQFFMEAMQAAGVPKDDPAVQRALTFLNRCQNLPGEQNDQPFAKQVSDDDKGGFVYNPAGRKGAATPSGGLRSEGAMTYAGLKSFLYAGVDKKDPRVQGAVKWIARHYTLDENPGQGQSGLYYYYHTFAKAMAALGEGDEFTDAKGQKHNWKRELFEALKSRQRADGAWSNAKDLFYESDPNLCAAYCLMALSYCKPSAAGK
jgi:squalene-hopene/tetraprenyl-beta-curcumene cyclase